MSAPEVPIVRAWPIELLFLPTSAIHHFNSILILISFRVIQHENTALLYFGQRVLNTRRPCAAIDKANVEIAVGVPVNKSSVILEGVLTPSRVGREIGFGIASILLVAGVP